MKKHKDSLQFSCYWRSIPCPISLYATPLDVQIITKSNHIKTFTLTPTAFMLLTFNIKEVYIEILAKERRQKLLSTYSLSTYCNDSWLKVINKEATCTVLSNNNGAIMIVSAEAANDLYI